MRNAFIQLWHILITLGVVEILEISIGGFNDSSKNYVKYTYILEPLLKSPIWKVHWMII